MQHIGGNTAQILKGDALELLGGLPAASVHAVITDPPYGLTANTDIVDLLDAWLNNKRYIGGNAGYGGHDWDHSVPGPELWRAAAHVLAPGGFLLAFAAARTAHLTACALALANLEIRDTLHWTYPAARMPSRDLGRQVRQDYNDEETARRLDGARSRLRPAHEPIIVARNMLVEDTLLDNVLQFGTGAIRHPNGAKTLTNLVATHEIECTANNCAKYCPIDTDDFGPETSHIYPGAEVRGPVARVAKPRRAERPITSTGEGHDTVKPLALMRYLIRAFTKPGDTVLDPFLGSGTTAEAALLEGRNIIGCEMTETYLPLIQQRLERVKDARNAQQNGGVAAAA